MKKILLFITSLICLASLNATALMIEVPIKTMVQQSDRIYSGKIISVTTHKKIFTDKNFGLYRIITLDVDENIKGDSVSQVEIFESGGNLNGYDTRTSISPHFNENELVVLFLKQGQNNQFNILHHYQGKRTFPDKQIRELFVQELNKYL